MTLATGDLADLERVAVEAARAGAAVVAEGADSGAIAEVKGAGDYVTAVDRAAEDAVRASLAGAASIPVLGEEGGGALGDLTWVVDPLDGTTNFVHGFPVVCVAVALVAEGRPVVGAIEAPLLGLSFRARRGGGAWTTTREAPEARMRVSDRPRDRAIVATGFPFRRKENASRHLAVVGRALERFEDLRRPGAAALDLAWVAAGVFDGFFELGLSVWDVAAGAIMVEEAGGVVSDWSGGDAHLAGDVLAGSAAVHRELLAIVGD